jgi:DNA-binding transcriptional regulator YdaS (Cro superfamily)
LSVLAIGEKFEMIDVMSEIIACFQLVVVSKPNLNQTVTICEYLPPTSAACLTLGKFTLEA